MCSSSVLSEPVPDVLMQLITSFEKFLKNQKETSDVISKFSDTNLKKVLQDTTTQSQVGRLTCRQASIPAPIAKLR